MKEEIAKLLQEKENGDLTVCVKLYNYYIKTNNFDKAYSCIKEIIDFDKENYLPDDLKSYYEYIYAVYLIDKKEYLEAFKYLVDSANNNFYCANIMLGNMYEYGEYGLEKNIKKAIYHYSKVCFLGDNIFCNKIHYIIKQLKIKDDNVTLNDIFNNYKHILVNACKTGKYGSCVFLYDLVKQIKGKEKARIYLREKIGYEKIILNYIKLKLKIIKHFFNRDKMEFAC